jgi:hypothetical protein
MESDSNAAVRVVAFSEFDDDQLIDPKTVALWLKNTTKTLEVWRSKGTGPPFVRMSARRVLYRVGAVREFVRTQGRTQIEPEMRRNGHKKTKQQPKPEQNPPARYPSRRRLRLNRRMSA